MRPHFHFTAERGWLNDPNACVYFDGEYHLCFQHNPDPAGQAGVDMRWGHAVSSDLIRWVQLPDAILPYGGGCIYSGSAVVDFNNSSGLGINGVPPLVAAFTHAKRPFGQAIAYSVDRGLSWRLHAGGRHVVANQGVDLEERDPRIFLHAPSGKWVMVLWLAEGHVRFFNSDNLLDWNHGGDFHGEGFYECPDLFELPLHGAPGGGKWVLTDATARYWVGDFDGRRFTAEAGPLKLEYGGNFYAAQTWTNTGGRTLQIAWMRGGQYPGMPFNQQMSFPCELSLARTPRGIRLRRLPAAEIAALHHPENSITARHLEADGTISLSAAAAALDISAEIAPVPGACLDFSFRGLNLSCSASNIGIPGRDMPLPGGEGTIKLRILLDTASVEIFAHDGEFCMAACFIPQMGGLELQCRAIGGAVDIKSILVREVAVKPPKTVAVP